MNDIKVYDIATKVLSKEDEDEEVEVSIKVTVNNSSDDSDLYIELLGIDSEDFEVTSIDLHGRVDIGETKIITGRTFIDKNIYDMVVKWQVR